MRILMRASQTPFDNFNPLNTVVYNKLWSNIGNLLFPFSLYRNILSEDVSIDIYSKAPPNPADADFINENYDVLMIPLANAFRSTFAYQLQKWTELIKKVKIPCVVAGVGSQCDLDFSPQSRFDFDDTVKEFCSAVASKSACIGVRGELTYAYLERLGFKSVTRIIGCPSMYLFGSELPTQRSKAYGTELKISINSKNGDTNEIKRFLFNDANDYMYIPQENTDLALLYCGLPKDTNENSVFPLNLNNKTFFNDRSMFCINVPSWLKLLRSADLSIGTRIHGNIAAILAGTPAYIIATDSRVLELARYHNIPYITPKEFDFSKSISEIYEETDFTSIYKGHKERYENFVDFLYVNGIRTVEQPNAFFDSKINAIDHHGPVRNILKVSDVEAAKRLNGYYSHLQKKIDTQNKTISELKKEKQSLEAKLKNPIV
ncbi:MAG: polysaccharide pyruvyl transferase family protein [Eubacterium sp.]|nr:polysaccharide pyruvyl transferase family protein [Eubacterium sp.]